MRDPFFRGKRGETSDQNFVELLLKRCRKTPDRVAFTFLTDGEREGPSLTYAALDRGARRIGAWLQKNAAFGDRAVLVYPPGLEFIEAFFGCLYAGVVPVIAYPPDPLRLEQTIPIFRAIVEDADAALVLTSASYPAKEINGRRWAVTDEIPAILEKEWKKPKIRPESLALIQYTSGTTASPKGVVLNHRNLLSDLRVVQRFCGHTSKDRGVFWVPHYHNFGLIASILHPIHAGFPSWLMSTNAFLERPLRWLQAISRLKGTISVAPNFAYQLCARVITPDERKLLDLNSWNTATTGGEPVSPETLQLFAKAFEPCGFRWKSFQPGYGLGEATSVVTAKPCKRSPVILAVDRETHGPKTAPSNRRDRSQVKSLVSCGRVSPEMNVVVVDPKTHFRCRPGRIGEIWLSGPNISPGYWRRPKESRLVFRAYLKDKRKGPFLRTGDLGFFHKSELFITGRLKDLIIIRGKNYYPQDIEQTVAKSHPAIRPYSCAVFAVESDGGEERLVIAAEVERRSDDNKSYESRRRVPAVPLDPKSVASFDAEETIRAVRKAISEQHGLQAHAVVLLQAGSMEKTGSGKVKRNGCRQGFLSKTLKIVSEDQLEGTAFSAEPLSSLTSQNFDGDVIERHLISEISRIIHVRAKRLVVHEPLSQWGLDSLQIIQIKNHVAGKWGFDLTFDELFRGISIQQIAEKIAQSQPRPAALFVPTHQGHVNQFPLSYGQRSLWFIYQLDPQGVAYNIFYALRIKGPWKRAALKRSVQKLIDRHPILRTVYGGQGMESFQAVKDNRFFHFEEVNATFWGEDRLKKRMQFEADRPFDLEKGPVLRVHLFSRSKTEATLLLTAHHIAVDFWSLEILAAELAAIYNADALKKPVALEPIRADYRDFVRWQSDLMKGPRQESMKSYWEKELEAPLPVLDLPTDRHRPAQQTFHGASKRFSLSKKLTENLRTLGSKENATLFAILLTAYKILLYRYTMQEDMIVGIPTLGRNLSEFENTVGYFVNPLPIRADLSGQPTFRALLAQVQRKLLGALNHQDYPFLQLVNQLKVPRDGAHSPIFQVSFAWEAPHEKGGLRTSGGGCRFELSDIGQRGAAFDMNLSVLASAGSLQMEIQYNTDLFNPDRIDRMTGHLQTLLEGIVANPDETISQLPILTEKERHQILVEWNDTKRDYPKDKCLHQVFEEQAERTPNNVAVSFKGRRLTYRDLNAKANQLAHYLRRHGVGPDVLVGICAERSLEMIIGLLGIWKAGGAYVPLDPAYPTERLLFMLEDAGAPVLITTSNHADIFTACDRRILCLDSAWEEISRESDQVLPNLATPDNLSYVIFTSGSTGRPKGVMISHGALHNHMLWMEERFPLHESDRVLQKTSISFDASVWEFWAPLLSGAQLILARPGGHLDTAYLADVISNEKVTILQVVPALLELLLREAGIGDCTCLRRVFCGGEALTADLQTRFKDALPTELINLYGPTEGCIDTHFWVCRGESQTSSVPIGYPISNMRSYILDKNLQLVPSMIPGELHIEGRGIARGYLHRPELTDEKFIRKNVTAERDSRLYRTGDLARYLPDGNIEFLGRMDHQVKIQGFRIELGEIEAALARYPGLQKVVVLAREDEPGKKRLVGYVTAKGGSSPSVSGLRDFLKKTLPDFMVPSTFVHLDELPLTPSGKIDRKNLPRPDQTRVATTNFHEGPRDALETEIIGVWQEILNVHPIGIHDNFFDLGGDSLSAIRILSRIRGIGCKKIPLASLLQAGTVGQLAAIIRGDGLFASFSSLVPLQSGGAMRPLFLIHPIGGHVFCYTDLARELGVGRPIYALQSQGLDGKKPPCDGVQAMAASYIQEIEKVQPKGPYFLGGWSMGGIVAFEIACQLEEKGQETGFLAAVDSKLLRFPKAENGKDLTLLVNLFTSHLSGMLGKAFPLSREELVKLDSGSQIAFVLDTARKLGFFPPGLEAPQIRAFFDVFQANVRAVRQYQPRPWGGRVTYFRASSEWEPEERAGVVLEWERFAKGGVETRLIHGNHYSILKGSSLKKMVQELEACLKTAEAGSSAADAFQDAGDYKFG